MPMGESLHKNANGAGFKELLGSQTHLHQEDDIRIPQGQKLLRLGSAQILPSVSFQLAVICILYHIF